MPEQIIANDYISTYTGVKFYPLNPRKEDVNILDIAHGLSLVCRFNGHILHFFSVAQHSLNGAYALKELGYSARIQFLFLMHDTTESYLGDITRPIKKNMPDYMEWEEKLANVIYEAFNVVPPTDEEWAIVKMMDDEMLAHEGKNLKKVWHLEPTIPFKNVIFRKLDPEFVRDMFVKRFDELISELGL